MRLNTRGSGGRAARSIFESQQLLGPESFVVNLGRGLDQVLKVGPKEEVPEVDKLAVSLILDVDDTPSVLASANGLALDDHVALRTDNGEWNNTPYTFVEGCLLLIVVFMVNRIEADVVILKVLLDSRLERITFLQGERVGLGNDWHNVDDLAQFFHDNDVNRAELVTGRVEEEQAAVNARVLDVAITHGSKLLAEVCAVLVLDILDDCIPAALVVDLVAISGGVNNVQLELDAILRNDMRHSLNLSSLTHGLVVFKAALGVDKVRRENGVDQSTLSESSLADDHDIELEPALQKLVFDLARDRVETDIRRSANFLDCSSGHIFLFVS